MNCCSARQSQTITDGKFKRDELRHTDVERGARAYLCVATGVVQFQVAVCVFGLRTVSARERGGCCWWREVEE